MEQVSVAIKKHRHKYLEGPKMVKKNICSSVASAPRNLAFALPEGPSCQRALSCLANFVRGADTRMMAMAMVGWVMVAGKGVRKGGRMLCFASAKAKEKKGEWGSERRWRCWGEVMWTREGGKAAMLCCKAKQRKT